MEATTMAGSIVGKKHKGVCLWAGHLKGFEHHPIRYRVREDREASLNTVAGLDREWLDVYVQWYRSRGQPEQAMQLKADWLTCQRSAA
jgi:hypothetical protein